MKKRPDIILIEVDQMSAAALGLYGNPVVRTPVLARLAASGMFFETAYCNYPACVPSRCSMMSGRYASTIRSHANFMHLNPQEISLPLVLKQAGYTTTLVGKNHCFMEGRRGNLYPSAAAGIETEDKPDEVRRLFDRVFLATHISVQGQEQDPELEASMKWAREHCFGNQHHFGVNPYPSDKSITARLCSEACNEIRDLTAREDPYFMWLSIPDPHTPYQVSEPYASMYDPEDIPAPIPASLEGKPERQRIAYYLDDNHKYDDAHFRRMRAIHYGMINQIDDYLGRVVDVLQEQGRMENTIIVFTSDHGDAMGDHGIIQKHNFFYDAICRIPLFISWPGQIAPGRFEDPVDLVDLLPTLLDLIGVDEPYGIQGKSLAPVLRGDSPDHKEFIVIESGEPGIPPRLEDILDEDGKPVDRGTSFAWCAFREAWLGRGKCIRDRCWKLAVYANGEGELYDMQADPDERSNLYDQAEYLSIRQAMEAKLLHWCIDSTDSVPLNTTCGMRLLPVHT